MARAGDVVDLMRVGVYVDAFNLYHGGRAHFGGGGVAGWRWLDIRRLASTLVGDDRQPFPFLSLEHGNDSRFALCVRQ